MGDRFEVVFEELVAAGASTNEVGGGLADLAARMNGLQGAGSATGDAACAGSFDAMTAIYQDQFLDLSKRALSLGSATLVAGDSYSATEEGTAGSFGAPGNP